MLDLENEDKKVDIEDVMRAMSSAMDAKMAHDRQRQEHIDNGGYSWGWYGSTLIGEMEDTQKLLGERLDKYIDQRIAAAINNLTLSLSKGFS